jgi:capsular polysaccharide biosynthesis protein
MYPLRPPTNEDKKRNTIFNESTVTTKPECIDLMQACTIIYDGKNRLFVDKNGVRVSDYSTMNGFLLTKRCQNKSNLQHIRGVSLMLCAHNSNNFYHWHFDLLPKLCMAQSAGIKISDIDNFIIDKRDNGFQVETLLAAGVKAEQIRFVDIDNCHLFCDEILLIKIYNNQGMTQSRRHIDWIRSSFLKIQLYSGNKTLDTQNKIAIKRETRGFANAELVYKKLQDKGYICIQPENLTYKEQVTLFSNATHIVAPHGAALSLIAYCKPNTIVHEYYGSHVQPCFWSIASTLGLNYHNYNCSDITDKDTIRNNKNLSIRLSENINATADQIDLICD